MFEKNSKSLGVLHEKVVKKKIHYFIVNSADREIITGFVFYLWLAVFQILENNRLVLFRWFTNFYYVRCVLI